MSNWRDKSFSVRRKETESFNAAILGDGLDLAIEWISDSLEVDDVFSEEKIISWIKDNYLPEKIFRIIDLDVWATENGYKIIEEE